jgi:D-xylonolactonase
MRAAPEPVCVLPIAAELGEGPVWRARERALWFVDIKASRIHRFRPDTGAHRDWKAPAPVGFIAPVEGGGWIAGLKTGLHRFDPESGAFTLLKRVEDPGLDNRLNDGYVDAQGRLWFGSMHDPEEALTGALYRFDRNELTCWDEGYCITNGPVTNPEGSILYHTDTLQKVIWAFDLGSDGSLWNKREFVRVEDKAGHPDGSAVDVEGCLWIALYGGWGARRYSPAGEILQYVRFPVANVTKLAFGGADLKTAYATTAWNGLSAGEREEQPLAGDLFAFSVEVPGEPQHEVRQV